MSSLFVLFAPLEGWRRVEVTDRRPKGDWARVVRKPVDEDCPGKDRTVLVMDNLSAHPRPHWMRRLDPPGPGASRSGGKFATRPSMGAG